MNRLLAAVAALEAAVIVVLAALLLQGPGPPAVSGPAGQEAEPTASRPPGLAAEPAPPRVPLPGPGPAVPGDPVGILLYGRLADPVGRPVPGALVAVMDESRPGQAGRTMAATTESAYAVVGLRPGSYKLHCRAKGFKDLALPLDLDGRPSQRRLDLTLTPVVILSVRFLAEDGKPLAEKLRELKLGQLDSCLSAVATRSLLEGDLPPTLSATPDGIGIGTWRSLWDQRIRMGRKTLADGELELQESPPVFVSALLRHRVLATQEVAAGTLEVVFKIPARELAGLLVKVRLQAVDALTGQPIADAGVNLSTSGSGTLGLKTGPDGRYEWADLPPGLLELSVLPPGYERYDRVLRLEPGQSLDLGALPLHQAVTIEGRLVTESAPEDQVRLECGRLDPTESGPMALQIPRMGHQIQADGAFRIAGAGRGIYLLRATVAGKGMAWARVDTRGGAVSGVELKVPPCTRVQAAFPGEETALAFVLLRDHEDLPIWSGRIYRSGVSIPCLPPGGYTLELHDRQGLQRRVPFTVGTAPVKLEIPR